MSIKTVPQMLLVLTCTVSAFAQRANQSPLGIPGTTAEYSGHASAPLLDDESAERPRTPFERMERTFTVTKPDDDISFAPGTVSVAELRHPMSRLGASLIHRAQHYASAGKHAKAIEVLKEALTESSASAYARSLLGVEYLKVGDPHAAIANLKEAVRLLPSLSANHSNLGYALCQIGNRRAGEQELREAIEADRLTSTPQFVLGVILLDRDGQEARDHLLLAQNINRARLALAVYYERHGEMIAAREELKEYLQLNHSANAAELMSWTSHTASLERPTAAFGFPSPEDR